MQSFINGFIDVELYLCIFKFANKLYILFVAIFHDANDQERQFRD